MAGSRLVLAHHLNYDNEHYDPGDVWEPPTTKLVYNKKTKELDEVPLSVPEQEKLTAELVANRTLVREDEVAPAVVISAQDKEIERLNAELEELKARMGVPARLGDGGGVTPAEDDDDDDEPPAAATHPRNSGGRRR